MTQSPDEVKFLELLLRVRSGSITQEDWINTNNQWEGNLSSAQKEESFNHEKVITQMETREEVKIGNHFKLAEKDVPVAKIRSEGSGYHHSRCTKQLGKIPAVSLVSVGSQVTLTKNQKELTALRLNNGSVGTVKAIIHAGNTSPPRFPEAVVVNFPNYEEPEWIPGTKLKTEMNLKMLNQLILT